MIGESQIIILQHNRHVPVRLIRKTEHGCLVHHVIAQKYRVLPGLTTRSNGSLTISSSKFSCSPLMYNNDQTEIIRGRTAVMNAYLSFIAL